MISPTNSNDISDARLVAYIDGELSPDDRAAISRALQGNPQLRERLEFLNSGSRPFGEAFDLLMAAAPEDRLQAMFAGLAESAGAASSPADNVVPLRPAATRGGSTFGRLAAAASIALIAYGGGMATSTLFPPKEAPQPAPQQAAATRGWVEAVAQYVSLFSQDTLAGMPAELAAREANLQRVSAALGKPIAADALSGLPSLDFRGTQLLQLEGRPIAQIAFLSDTGKPVAICIIKTPRPAEAAKPDRRHGLNIVHWIDGGYAYMVIGDLPADALTTISEAARARLS